ncbi:DUF393 domain-containing protein [Halobacillus salinarum]|uniref:DUF393 domain-containing protein n=1 Tax=Halobacillus salinarum TaxID=2932257 RepID=A0ABY4EF49_9BACI|nr:DCC1-like thiol-disulfide oxidoreductase family protein [Halobacillus salinarum]UOQ42605.1 DUF393 domain-containing protein [Halobacillus salinarum]
MKPFRNQKVIIFYDGWCPLCKNAKANLEKVDTFQLLEFENFREKSVMETYSLDQQKLEKRIQSKRINSRKHKEGISSLIQITKRTPLLWGMTLLMSAAKIIGIGDRIYDYVAQKRSIVPTGHCKDGVCPLDQSKN